MSQGIHTEQTFEAEIEAHLLAHGYESTAPTDFVQTTQPKVWAKLQAIHKDKLPALLIKEVCKVMDKRGSREVLRHGFSFYGKKVQLAFFRPGSSKNLELWELYGQNRLSVVRQLRYAPNSGKKRRRLSSRRLRCLATRNATAKLRRFICTRCARPSRRSSPSMGAGRSARL